MRFEWDGNRSIPALVLFVAVLTAGCGGGGGASNDGRTDATISLFAGSLQQPGSADGMGGAARFFAPNAITAMPDGSLRVADGENALVRSVSPAGDVATASFVTAQGGARFQVLGRSVSSVAADPSGKLYISRIFGNTAYQVDVADSTGTLQPKAATYAFAMAAGTGDRLYLVPGNSNVIERIGADGTRATLASGWQSYALAVDSAGSVFSAGYDHAIRIVDAAGGVRVFAGRPGEAGTADGDAASARFDRPAALALDPAGNLYVADATMIRRITPAGQVRTVAGTPGDASLRIGALPGAVGGIKGLAWSGGMLYATIANAVVRIGPLE